MAPGEAAPLAPGEGVQHKSDQPKIMGMSKRLFFIVLGVVGFIILAVALGAGLGIGLSKNKDDDSSCVVLDLDITSC
jgi:hypothetical protein